jgi:transmembrane sensor
MSNIRELPTDEAIYGRASEWIARFDRGLSPGEESEFKVWLRERNENYSAFMKMARLWDRMDALARLAEICPDSKQGSRTRRYAWPLAASVLVTVAIAGWGVFNARLTDPRDATVVAASRDVYETSIGEQAAFRLQDGTEIVLNTNSRVSISYTATDRFLYLDRGEMHVTVAHDRARPLSVIAGGRVMRAVGTEFNVEITSDQTIELMVTEGVVMVGILDNPSGVAGPEQPVLLKPSSALVVAGQEVVIAEDRLGDPLEKVETREIDAEEIAIKLSWREGNLIFRGESLEEAVSEIGRYTAVEFVFLNDESKKVKVAGLFKAGDVDGLLTALRQNFNISYEWVGDDKIILSSH